MLNQFSWQQFLIASILIALLWYAVIILLYYRKQFINLFFRSAENKPTQKLKNDWDDEFEEAPDENDNLIGNQALPEGVSEVSTEMFGFAPTNQIPQAINADEKYVQLGLIPDILKELKGLFKVLREGNGDKEDFFSLFNIIKSKYPNITLVQDHKQVLNEFILENLPFEISESELENLWT